ncbi:20129_t:CDS:1, partial [Racocetra persica]
NNESIENENSESIENIDNTEDIVINNDVIEKNDGENDIVNEEVTENAIIETIDDDKETYEVIDTLNNSSEAEEIKPYTILSQDDMNIENKTKDTKSIHTGDDENDFDFIDNTVFDSNSSTNLNYDETMDARKPLIVVDSNVEESNEAALTQIKKQSQNEQVITSPMGGVENINVTNEENDDEFVIVNTSN